MTACYAIISETNLHCSHLAALSAERARAPLVQIYANLPSLNFLQAGCPYCHPTNSVKALKDYHASELFVNLLVLPLLQNVDVISTQAVRDPLKPNMPHPSATSTPGLIHTTRTTVSNGC